MITCETSGSHHFACDCREAYTRKLEELILDTAKVNGWKNLRVEERRQTGG